MSLTLFPPRAPSRLGPQMSDLHLNTVQEQKSNMSSASPLSATPTNFDNRTSIVPPLPTFASRSESRSGSPLRTTTNSRQNSPTRAAQNLTPPPTVGLPPLPVDAAAGSRRPVSPNTKTTSIVKGSYLAGAKIKAKETFMRRKGSMPEIQTNNILVAELPMDSPTIPGRPPMHDRQASLPASAFSAAVFSEATMVKLPHGMEKRDHMHKRSASNIREADMSKVLLHKRSGSTIRTVEIPKLQLQTKLGAQTAIKTSRSPSQQPSSVAITPVQSPLEDLPPAVPPKEPKLAPLNVTRTATTNRTRAGSEPYLERPPQPNTLHKRQASAQEYRREPQRLKTTTTTITPTPTTAQPKRRSTAYRAIPRGMRPIDAVKSLQAPVVASLQSAARKTCEKFAILSPGEVDALTQELAQLEERCEYLRKTHNSLRSGKKALHIKMLQHLRSDRSGSFSRETLLKQQEALADLDSSIDDWEAKMDRAETRRAQVHRKLLEHVAAALSVPAKVDLHADTPPSTPEDRKSLDDRCQSIKVYALLADVEQEFGKMLKEARG